MTDRARTFALCLLVLPATLPLVAAPPAPETPAGATLWALELGVSDLDRSVGFYTEALGFRLERRDAAQAVLRNGDSRLILAPTAEPAAPAAMTRVYLNMSVGNLTAIADRAVRMGGHLEDPSPITSAVGMYIEIRDPSGHPIHLIDHPWDEMASTDRPSVFNYGINVPSVEEAEPFLTALGFEVSTRDYLPDTLVFKKQGIGYLVVHPHAEKAWEPGWSSGALILAGGRTPAAPLRGPSGILVKTMVTD